MKQTINSNLVGADVSTTPFYIGHVEANLISADLSEIGVANPYDTCDAKIGKEVNLMKKFTKNNWYWAITIGLLIWGLIGWANALHEVNDRMERSLVDLDGIESVKVNGEAFDGEVVLTINGHDYLIEGDGHVIR